jgi:hypothetical protein
VVLQEALTEPINKQNRMFHAAASRPVLHHFGLTTAHLEAMVDWCAKVLAMTPNRRAYTGESPLAKPMDPRVLM